VNESHAEVLIIGAGPTGLFLAGELARHGVRARIIDRFLTPHTQTRATGIQPGAMEVLHRAGVSEKFLAKRWANTLEVVDGATICTPEVAGIAPGGTVLVRPDGYVAFQADRWGVEARNALDELLLSQFCPGSELV
jgi:2-polyprenyl-6-methoxyphenol hydroxylase-like FAD-dependent oxidoreductase